MAFQQGFNGDLMPLASSSVAWPVPSHYLKQCWNILIGALGTNFNEILFEIQKFSFKTMHLNMSSAKWRPFCFVLYVLST